MTDDRADPLRRAAFVDRDGTLNVDRDYLGDPAGVELVPGAAGAVRRLNDAGIATIVVTNQSGIARGFFGEADYERVRERLDELFAAEGARLDASYHCPHHPDVSGPCACRKPGTLLYERAAAEHGLDPRRCLFVGDRWRDVQPATAFGGLGVLVPSVATPPTDVDRARRDAVVRETLADAVALFLDGANAPRA